MNRTTRRNRTFNQKNDKYRGIKGKFRKKQLYKKEKNKQDIVDDEIKSLNERSLHVNTAAAQNFSDFPLSQKTLDGLSHWKYEVPTDIQRESLGLALQGNDILGAAKTGSGKTLAFIIPVLECLYKLKWSQMDGLGALIISPTRELAYQTFEVLRKVGKFHDLSAGLVIGGKQLREESDRIHRTNIVICTPGRLLQHMDETATFTADSMQILVLDEADRILDLGFAQTMNAIIDNLPEQRQTLLFSATQTRSVKDLARLSLKDPMYVSVHEKAQHSTPARLEQNYMVCELHDKLNLLWSFLRNHTKSKILVFLTSCKQVKYVFEAFKRLRPGITVLALHGSMNQLKRVEVYKQFVWKQHAVLFATDIAARGLDFPAVNWVLQLDCPEDANTYIHRAGRTARYEKDGEALLMLMPSEEEAMIQQLKDKKIPVDKIRVNNKKFYSIQSKLESNCAADPSLKEMAQRAFVSYLRSVYLMSNKKVFNIKALDIEQYSRSLGLAIAPRVRFLDKEKKRLAEKENAKANIENRTFGKNSKLDFAKKSVSSDDSDSDLEEEERKPSDGGDETSDSEDSAQGNESVNQSSETDSEEESDLGDADEEIGVETSADKDLVKSDNLNALTKKKTKTKSEVLKNVTKIKGKPFTSESQVDLVKKTSVVKRSSGASSSSSDDSESSDDSTEESDDEEESDGNENADGNSDNGSDEDDSDGSEDSGEDESDVTSRSGKGFQFSVDDDGDDLFIVRRNVDVKIDDSSPEKQEVGSNSKKKEKDKQTTKFAVAKKLLKKNMKVNTRIVFDEEGEEVEDVMKKPQAKLEEEEENEAGGIDISAARKRMMEEDKFDKKLHREKIRQKHREERLKKREENRKKKQPKQESSEEEGEAVLDVGNEGDNPLDFIPDPDKVYGGDSSSSSEEEEEEEGPRLKRMRLHQEAESSSSEEEGDSEEEEEEEESDEEDDEAMDTGLSLQGDEDLAMKLLHGVG